MITFQITQEDIDNGERAQCKYCPTALALKRHFNSDRVLVLPTRIYVSNIRKFIPSDELKDFIHHFDNQDNFPKVEPGEYEMFEVDKKG